MVQFTSQGKFRDHGIASPQFIVQTSRQPANILLLGTYQQSSEPWFFSEHFDVFLCTHSVVSKVLLKLIEIFRNVYWYVI